MGSRQVGRSGVVRGIEFINPFITLFKMKKQLLVIICLVLVSVGVQAQKVVNLSKSPMDKAYYPVNFAHDRKGADKAVVSVTYCRPAKNGREVFGKLVPFGKVWRTGANESTEIKFFQDVTIQGKTVKAGNYSLFSIPGEKEWTIILSSDVNFWGAFKYNEAHDVLKATVPAKKAESVFENMTIEFVNGMDKEAILQIVWDTTLVELPIAF